MKLGPGLLRYETILKHVQYLLHQLCGQCSGLPMLSRISVLFVLLA